MDLSHLVAWGTPCVAAAATVALGVRRAQRKESVGGLTALGTAIGIGFVFMFVQVWLHSSCVDAKLCEYRGDENMSYWFHSLFAFPVYALLYYSAANRKT